MSPKRITVSTSGVPKMIKKMADDEVKFHLAVSLHSALDEVRDQIMPFNKNFPLTDLRDSLEYWYEKTQRDKLLMNMLFGKASMTLEKI